MKITTNNKPRDVLFGYEIPEHRAEFDYMTDEDFAEQEFFCFKGQVYCLGDFMGHVSFLPENHPFKEWHGYMGMTAFSGILVKMVQDGEKVVVGQWVS